MKNRISDSYQKLLDHQDFETLQLKYLEERKARRVNWELKKNSGITLFDPVIATSHRGKLMTAPLILFPWLDSSLSSEASGYESILNEIIRSKYESTFNLIEKYVTKFKINFPAHADQPRFDPVTRPFEYLKSITPLEVQFKYNWFQEPEDAFERILITEKVFSEELKSLKLEAEYLFRESLGLNPDQNKWKSERELFELIKLRFDNLDILSQSSPGWLGSQRFDIYIPQLNAAIEYNGIQHYEPVDLFGGEKGLKKTQRRDEEKRRKCKENNCHLLEVTEDYSFTKICAWVVRLIDEEK